METQGTTAKQRRRVLQQEVVQERTTYHVTCYAPREGDLALTLRDSKSQIEIDRSKRISQILRERGDTHTYALSAGGGGSVIGYPEKFSVRRMLTEDIHLFDGEHLHYAGVWLPVGHTIVMSAKGYPVVIATGGTHCLIMATNWKSLTRPTGDAIHRIAMAFEDRGIPREEVGIDVCFSVNPKAFAPTPRQGQPCFQKESIQTLRQWEPLIGRRDPNIIETHRGSRCPNFYALIKARANEPETRIRRVQNLQPLPVQGEFAHPNHEHGLLDTFENLIVVKRTHVR